MSALYHDSPSPTTKKCSQCHIEKPFPSFSVNNHDTSGYRSRCKDCEKLERDEKRRNKPPKPVFQLTLPLFKTCRICHVEKPCEAFEQLAATCIECRNAKRKAKAQERDLLQDPIPEGTQTCVKCEKTLPFNSFYRSRYRTSGYGNTCKVCDDERKQQWNHDNIEHVREYRRQYKNEVMPDYMKGYYKENIERMQDYSRRYYEETKEQQRQKRKEWQQNNLLKCRESNDRRRAIKRETKTGSVSYKRILERDGYWCYICEGEVTPGQVSFDHVIPLHRNGTHTEDNIKVVHKICNCRKRTRLLSEMTPFQRRGV